MKRTSFAFAACAALAALCVGASIPAFGAWNIESIADEVPGFRAPELAYDPSGNASVVYKTAEEILFTQRIGTTWSAPETVVSGWRSVGDFRFAYSSTGVAGVVFAGIEQPSGGRRQLAFVERTGGSWGSPQTLIQSNRIGDATRKLSVAYDDAGNPAVVYYLRGDFYLARRNGSTWSHANVAPSLFSGYKSCVALAFDPSDGQPAVTFGTGGPDDVPSNAYYSKFEGDSSSWVTEIAAIWPTYESMGEVSMAFSPLTGKPFIYAWHGDPYDLLYLTVSERTAPGSWFEATLGTGYNPSNIAFDAAGEAHVMFVPLTRTELMYSKRTTTGFWTFPTLVDSILVPDIYMMKASLKIDGTGKPTAAYGKETWVGETNYRDLRFATPGAACVSQGDCDDLNDCTDDICLLSGDCQYTPHADDTSCTDGICCAAVCVTAVCKSDAECDDTDPCTTVDWCDEPETCAATCLYQYAECGLADECCGPDCDWSTDLDCPCVPTHSKEKGPRCSDGLDNDCDGLIDSDDPDCQR